MPNPGAVSIPIHYTCPCFYAIHAICRSEFKSILYRESIIYINADKIKKKEICKIFEENGQSITADANKKVVDFLRQKGQ